MARVVLGSRALRSWDGEEWGLLQVLSLCRVLSPLWGVFPGSGFRSPRLLSFVSGALQSGSLPLHPPSPDSRPLSSIKLGTARNPLKGRGWLQRVMLIRSEIEMRRARRPSRSPPPEMVTEKSHK